MERVVAALERAGRIQLHRDAGDWLELAVSNLELEVIPISPGIAARSIADQLITATAIELDVPLITADQSLRASPAVRTIW